MRYRGAAARASVAGTALTLFTTPPFGHRAAPYPVLLVAMTVWGTLPMHMFLPALPAVAKDLAVSAAAVQMTVTVYVAGLAVGQLIHGPLSDRFGRRPVVLWGLALYVASTLFAMLAGSVEQLLAARLLQALGGCAGMVLGRAMVRDGATMENAARRIALLTMSVSVAPMLAPAVGGLLTGWFGWRTIFAVLGSGGLIVLCIAVLTLPETHRARPALQGGGNLLLDSYASLLRRPVFCAYLIAGPCLTSTMYGFLTVMPFLLVDRLHRPTEEVGFYYLILAGAAVVGGFVASRLPAHIGVRKAMYFAGGLAAIGGSSLLFFELSDRLSMVTVMVPILAVSAGIGIASPSAIAGATNADPTRIGAASGLLGFTQMSWGAVSTVLAGLGRPDSVLSVGVTVLFSAVVALVALALWGAQKTGR